MAKRTSDTTPNPPLELLTNRQEAIGKIEIQIQKGMQLINKEINSQNDYNELASAEQRWRKFTAELLKQLFSNTDLFAEFVAYGSVGVIRRRRPSLQEDTQKLRGNIHKKNNILESIKERIEIIPVSKTLAKQNNGQVSSTFDMGKVFIVHGHDNTAKLNAARFIERLSLEPIILHEQSSGGDTIIEKIERYSDVGFGIVLYTECDVGAVKSDSQNLHSRARQNVVFEHGYLIGKLGRKNVCALVKGEVETPNDISGVVYIPMNDDSWQFQVAKELKQANYEVDLNKLV